MYIYMYSIERERNVECVNRECYVCVFIYTCVDTYIYTYIYVQKIQKERLLILPVRRTLLPCPCRKMLTRRHLSACQPPPNTLWCSPRSVPISHPAGRSKPASEAVVAGAGVSAHTKDVVACKSIPQSNSSHSLQRVFYSANTYLPIFICIDKYLWIYECTFTSYCLHMNKTLWVPDTRTLIHARTQTRTHTNTCKNTHTHTQTQTVWYFTCFR